MSIPSTTLEDEALVQAALAGQPEYFSILVNRHASAVRNCIRSTVRNTSDVEDLVQDTFLKAWKHLSAFRFESSFRTWLISVALNEALALHRRRRYRPFCVPTPNLEALPSQSESPHQAFARSEAGIRVQAAVAKLPTKYRQVLVLCELEQLTMRETADRMKAKVSLIKTRLFRGRRMLLVALGKEAARRSCASARNS